MPVTLIPAPHVSKSTLCADCGHSKSSHCPSGMPHFLAGDFSYSCIAEHCQAGIYENGSSRWCACKGFKNPYNQRVSIWKPPTTPETPCAKCNHPRAHHCTKSKDSAGLTVNGQRYGCQHLLQWLQNDMRGQPACTSTCCNEIVDVTRQKFCGCTKFISPYSRRKKREQKMPLFTDEERNQMHEKYLAEQEQKRKPAPKTRAEILLEVYRDYPDLSTQELSEAAGRSQRWVRKTLRDAGIKPARNSRKLAEEGIAAMITDKQKLKAVENVLDGKPTLIAQARAAFAERFHDELFAWLTESGTSGHVGRASIHFMQELDRVVGEARRKAIYEAEWNKFAAIQKASNPELWRCFSTGAVYFEDDDISYREEYTRKFYGVQL